MRVILRLSYRLLLRYEIFFKITGSFNIFIKYADNNICIKHTLISENCVLTTLDYFISLWYNFLYALKCILIIFFIFYSKYNVKGNEYYLLKY